MSKTITLEELPEAARRIIEDLFESDEPVEFTREGEPIGALLTYQRENDPSLELDPKEKADLMAAIAQGKEDIETDRYVTLEEFRLKYADHLQNDAI